MRNRLYKILPWTALLGAVIVAAVLILGGGQREKMLVDTGETTRAVEAALAKFDPLAPASADDPALLDAVEELRAGPYIASAWLFDAQGQTLYGQGSTGFQDSVQERMSLDFQRILASVPEGTFSAEQTLLLSAASAIQAEGEHNDIYLHRVHAVYDAEGQLVAVVGVAYDVSVSAAAAPNAGWIASMLLGLFGFALYWLSLPVWTALDANRNGEPAWVWGAFVLLGNVVALIAYLLVKSAPRRPPAAE